MAGVLLPDSSATIFLEWLQNSDMILLLLFSVLFSGGKKTL